jgi:hypothetical protein
MFVLWFHRLFPQPEYFDECYIANHFLSPDATGTFDQSGFAFSCRLQQPASLERLRSDGGTESQYRPSLVLALGNYSRTTQILCSLRHRLRESSLVEQLTLIPQHPNLDVIRSVLSQFQPSSTNTGLDPDP